MVFFEDFRGGDFVESSRTFPEGWVVQEDSNFSDNTELADVQLIACSNRANETPTGKQCEFDNDGQSVTLELVDASYEVVVYEARTGHEVQRTTLDASAGGECPFVATFQKGDTTFVQEPDDDDYINALKPIIQP
jgi:hypothetical protein